MGLLQAYQADVLGDLNEDGGIGPDAIAELRRATDLSLQATKETARSIGHAMQPCVVMEKDTLG